jgi:hypothetical protein
VICDALERHSQAFARHALDVLQDLVHDDYVEGYLRSGEGIRGKQIVERSWRTTLAVSVCEIVKLQDGKIESARAYFGEAFEAAEWRARWASGSSKICSGWPLLTRQRGKKFSASAQNSSFGGCTGRAGKGMVRSLRGRSGCVRRPTCHERGESGSGDGQRSLCGRRLR